MGPTRARGSAGGRVVIRVLIVDDHQIVREGLRFLLDQQDDIEVIGECSNGADAIETARQLLPTVVLLDLLMPGIDALSALRQIKLNSPPPRS